METAFDYPALTKMVFEYVLILLFLLVHQLTLSVEGMSPIGHKEIFFKVKHTCKVRWDPPGHYITQ